MLIRSQDGKTLLNFGSSTAVEALEIEKVDVRIAYSNVCETCDLGKYTSVEKAVKVLDMIQEAYADAELIPMTVPNIGKMFAEAPASKENELLAEAIGEALMKKMVFQMPEDNEVEV